MISLENIFALVIAYLLGSIPTAVWIGQLFYNIDVREYGSGNAGATNTFRVLGKKAGIPVLFFDILKGLLAVLIPYIIGGSIPGSIKFVNLQLTLGIAAMLGHIFPVYVGFRGGKGIATLLGVIIAIHFNAALIAIGVFLTIFLITRYVSLGAIGAAISFPIILILVFKITIPSLIIFSLFIAILVLITHQKNIERLLRKEESKAKLKIKKKKNTDV